jgi:hypothetical protein
MPDGDGLVAGQVRSDFTAEEAVDFCKEKKGGLDKHETDRRLQRQMGGIGVMGLTSLALELGGEGGRRDLGETLWYVGLLTLHRDAR